MNGIPAKKIKSRPQNWISLINFVENRSKQKVRLPYCNLYAYAANNPLRYIDPDGRFQKLPDGSLKVTFTNTFVKVTTKLSAGTMTRKYQAVYLYTNNGEQVLAFKNLTNKSIDFYGYALTDDQYTLVLDVYGKDEKQLNAVLDYDPQYTIQKILESDFEKTDMNHAEVAFPEEFKKGSGGKVVKEKELFSKKFYLQYRMGLRIFSSPITKKIEGSLIFYKEKNKDD